MALPAAIMPVEAEDLRLYLLNRGFTTTAERYEPASFGNALVQLERDPMAVRFVRDRGQWTVEIARLGWQDWFDPAIWRALLGSSMEPLETLSLAEQAMFVRAHLLDIVEVGGDGSGRALEKLTAWRAQRAVARRALPFDLPARTDGAGSSIQRCRIPR